MIHELIVTSAPRGLQPGRSGFTTVLQTRGIHPELARRLEAASAYRHVFPQGDPRNPVIRAHIVVQGPAGTASVLSRIVDAGNGYDGRSNKLAHHVALDAAEVATRAHSSPAAALLALERADAYMRVWQGEPREQPAGPFVPPASVNPGPCGLWLRAAGDAGWAGFIADRAMRREPTWIIAPAGVDLVELFAEALALIPGPQRWGVTFTSYALSAGDALWLGTVEGSPEAEAARGQSRIAVVDLVRPKPLESVSPLIAAAQGTAPVPWKRDGHGAPAGGTTDPAGLAATNGTRPPPVSSRPPTLSAGGWQTVEVSDGAEAFADAKAAASRRSRWITAAIVFATLAIITAAVAIVWMNREALKGWLQRVGGDTDANHPVTPVHVEVSPPEAKGKPTPSGQSRAEPPSRPTGFAEVAKAAAQRAQMFANEVSAKEKAVEPHLTNAKEICKQLEGIANEAEQAIAADKSPQPAIERFATVKATFESAVTQADVITKEALRAAEDAETAARNAADQEELARKKWKAAKATLDECCSKEPAVSPKIPPLEAARSVAIKVLEDTEAGKTNADGWAARASKDAERFDEGSDLILQDLRSRVAAADERIGKSREVAAGARKAFGALKAQLEKAGHMPREGLDAAVAADQTKVLCEVGEARVALQLPSETVTTGIGATWTLVCASDATARAWGLKARSIAGEEVPLGSATIDGQGLLRVTLNEQTDENAALREALASAALQISDRSDPSRTTYVQLCQPQRLPPLEFAKFLDGTGDSYKPFWEIRRDLPTLNKLWPVAADMEGTCGPLTGETIQAPVDVPEKYVKAIDGQPVAWAMLWSEEGQPFVQVNLAMGKKKTAAVGMYVVGATLQGRWATLARLGCLGEQAATQDGAFCGLPKTIAKAGPDQRVDVAAMKPLVHELFVRELCDKLHVDPADQTDEKILQGFADHDKPMALNDWIEAVRKKLATYPGYQNWAATTYPAPGPDPMQIMKSNVGETIVLAPGSPLDQKVNEWQTNSRNHKAAQAAETPYVDAYWQDVEGRLAAEQCREYPAALLSRWHGELRRMQANEDTRALVEAVRGTDGKESPSAIFTGQVCVDFPSFGGRCVLVTFDTHDPSPGTSTKISNSGGNKPGGEQPTTTTEAAP